MNFNVNLGGGYQGRGGFGGGFDGGFDGGFQQQQPQFQQIALGQGINQQEYQTIIEACKKAYISKQKPMSSTACNLIKQYLGSAWLVICSPAQDKDYEFSVTRVSEGDFMSFTLDYTLFQVCKIDWS